MVLFLFHALVAAHIVTGSTGAIAFWVPVLGRKGGANHARWGKVFTFALLITGCVVAALAVIRVNRRDRG